MFLKSISVSLVFLFCFQLNPSTQSVERKIRDLDQYIQQAKEQWKVPGLAVAVVKDGKTLLAKGYGERELNKSQSVDSNTIFAICSTTKAMTSACIAMLVDEGKVKWDDPVVEYLPEFQLYDPYMTRSIRVRDLLTHNAGLGNADLLWYLWKHEPSEILYKMRMLEPSYPMRGGFTYQNIMYAAAGVLIERVSGQSWEDFVSQRIYQPLGMKNTFANQAISMSYKNRAIAHHWVNKEITPIPDGDADLIAPAGATWSTISDMAKWMHFVLDSAKIDGKRLISAKNYREWLKPQAIITDAGFYPTQKLTKPNWKTYALGWFQHDYLGRAVSFHTGSLQGTVAIIGLIPDENLGVYVFGNLDHAEVRHAIMYKVFDTFCGGDPSRDWSTELLDLYKGQEERAKKVKAEAEAKLGDPLDLVLPLSAFEGNYVDPYLGEIQIRSEGVRLLGKLGEFKISLKHKSLLTFEYQFTDAQWAEKGTIKFDAQGNQIKSLQVFGRTFEKDPT